MKSTQKVVKSSKLKFLQNTPITLWKIPIPITRISVECYINRST